MSYFGTAILVLFLLGLTGAGWYYLFKRFEARMSMRFDDLVQRSEETLKSFADVIEVLGTVIHNLDENSADLAERIQNVKLNAEKVLTELEKGDHKLDMIQGLALVIKQDRFLEHARILGAAHREGGKIDEDELARLEQMIEKMKLENYSRY